MRLTRDQVQRVWQAFEDDIALNEVQITTNDANKLTVYRVEIIEKLRPVSVSRTRVKKQRVS